MRSCLMTRGRIVLATMICLTAYGSAAVAQTDYYWQGGLAHWNTAATSWVSGGTTGSGVPWVNGNIANIGYVITSGSGGSNSGDGPGGYPGNLTSAPAITLDPNHPISVNQLVFGQNTSTSTNAKNSQYQLSGGTLNLGDGSNPGNITLDLSTTATYYPFQAAISSNINVAGNQALSFTVSLPILSTLAYSSYLFLSGSNTFNNVIVNGAPYNGASVNALIFTNAQSVNFQGQVPNITLGNNAAVDDLATR